MKYKYILPDLRVAYTRRDGEKMFGHSTYAFRNLVRKGTIKKIEIINNSQANSNEETEIIQ